MTYMGDLGGILDLLLLSFKFLTSIFSARLLKAAIIGSAYRIQGKPAQRNDEAIVTAMLDQSESNIVGNSFTSDTLLKTRNFNSVSIPMDNSLVETITEVGSTASVSAAARLERKSRHR